MSAREPISSNIYPTLTYEDAPAAIDWLCRAFGFEERLVVPNETGGVLHSELSFGPGVIMVSSPKSGRVGPTTLGGTYGGLCVRVDDPDAHHARAVAAGADVVQPLRDEAFGSRGYAVRDPGGHYWYFGTYVPGVHWEQS